MFVLFLICEIRALNNSENYIFDVFVYLRQLNDYLNIRLTEAVVNLDFQ